jgi:hypothetical protein
MYERRVVVHTQGMDDDNTPANPTGEINSQYTPIANAQFGSSEIERGRLLRYLAVPAHAAYQSSKMGNAAWVSLKMRCRWITSPSGLTATARIALWQV